MGFPTTTFDNTNDALSSMMNKAGAQGLSTSVSDGPDATVYAICSNLLSGLPGGTMTAGTGITTGVGTVYKATVIREGDLIVTKLLIDLTGLNSGGTAADIIGKNTTANSHFGQVTTAVNGTLQAISMVCLELPAGGDTDLDLYSASVGTGTEDVAISTLSGTQLINAGTQASGTVTAAATMPAADEYLYLCGQGTANATYTAGKFLITLYGTPA